MHPHRNVAAGDARTRGPGAQHRARREQIADAALAVAAESGLPAVSQAAVAARAGVSPGRVQHYFPAKESLVTAAFDRGNELAAARIDVVVGAAGDAATTLAAVLEGLIPHDAASRDHLRVRQAFVARGLVDEAIAERLRTQYATLHATLADLVARGGGDEPEDVAVRLVALAEGLADQVLIGACDAEVALRIVRRELPGRGREGQQRDGGDHQPVADRPAPVER